MVLNLKKIEKEIFLLKKKYIKFFDFTIYSQSEDAIITLFLYENLTDELLSLLILFVESHKKNNKNCTVFIFTNHNKKIDLFIKDEKIKVIFFPYSKKKFMTTRVIFNFFAIKKFRQFEKIYIFDSDLIAIKPYAGLDMLNKSFDIGLTFRNNWQHGNKFPVNAGFLICNYRNFKDSKIFNFADQYLKAFIETIRFQDVIHSKKIIDHEKIDFENWWGDQYLFLLLFPTQLNTTITIKKDFKYNEINYRFLNERLFNFSPFLLKKENNDFDMAKYFNENLKKTYFLHLKGSRKKFIKDIYLLLK